MLSARKVTLIPPKESQFGGGAEDIEESGSLTSVVEKSTDKIKSKIYDKIHRFIKIILKLARTIGYDDELRIKLRSGNYLEKSNIVDLLTHAMSAGKVLYGENEFIELLAESDVDPNLIINDNVRNKLIQFKNKNKKSINFEEKNKEVISKTTQSVPDNRKKTQITVVKKGAKRFLQDTEANGKNKLIVVNRDGPTIELDPNEDMDVDMSGKKRKLDEIEEDESVDDDEIDQTKWKTN